MSGGAHGFARTNLQLWNQLAAEGRAEADLAAIRAAYELGMRLFAGQFRPSGKTFLAHLVGTASVLAAAGAGPAVVASGLLHSAYTHGEFGDGRRGLAAAKREQVRRAVGEEVEALVARYTTLAWSEEALQAVRGRLAELAEADRQVLLVRLADTLEDHLDGGMRYCRKSASVGPAAVEAAEALGCPGLARALAEALPGPIPAPPATEILRTEHRGSFTIAPASHRPRLALRLRALVKQVLGRRP